MSIPFAVPDWMPGWLPFVVVVPVLLYAVVFLAIPFGVFGVKGRLDVLEARLDEIQGEIRLLSLRLPEPSRASDGSQFAPGDRPASARPPIPPNATVERFPDVAPLPERSVPPVDELSRRRWASEVDDAAPGVERSAPRRRSPERPDRAEPRLDWPR
jgi:hypothetical protein